MACRWQYRALLSVFSLRIWQGVGHSLVVDVNAVVFMLHRWWWVHVPRDKINRLGRATSSVGGRGRDGVVEEVRSATNNRGSREFTSQIQEKFEVLKSYWKEYANHHQAALTCCADRGRSPTMLPGTESEDVSGLNAALCPPTSCSTLACGSGPSSPASPHAAGCCTPDTASAAPGKKKHPGMDQSNSTLCPHVGVRPTVWTTLSPFAFFSVSSFPPCPGASVPSTGQRRTTGRSRISWRRHNPPWYDIYI